MSAPYGQHISLLSFFFVLACSRLYFVYCVCACLASFLLLSWCVVFPFVSGLILQQPVRSKSGSFYRNIQKHAPEEKKKKGGGERKRLRFVLFTGTSRRASTRSECNTLERSNPHTRSELNLFALAACEIDGSPNGRNTLHQLPLPTWTADNLLLSFPTRKKRASINDRPVSGGDFA